MPRVAFRPALRRQAPAAAGQHLGSGRVTLIALGIVALGFAARLGLDPLLANRATFIFFVPGVVAAAVGGFRAAAIATFAGAAAGVAADALTGPLLPGDWIAAAVFLVIGTVVAFGGAWLKEAREREETIARELAQREAHLTSILQTVPDAMIVIDEGGLIRDFSDTAERQFGWTAEEVTGRNVSMLMPSPIARRTTAIWNAITVPGSGASSASGAWWWASARMARPSRWSLPSARCSFARGASSPASSAT